MRVGWLTDKRVPVRGTPSFTWEWEDEWAAWERRQIEGWERWVPCVRGLWEWQSYSRPSSPPPPSLRLCGRWLSLLRPPLVLLAVRKSKWDTHLSKHIINKRLSCSLPVFIFTKQYMIVLVVLGMWLIFGGNNIKCNIPVFFLYEPKKT